MLKKNINKMEKRKNKKEKDEKEVAKKQSMLPRAR